MVDGNVLVYVQGVWVPLSVFLAAGHVASVAVRPINAVWLESAVADCAGQYCVDVHFCLYFPLRIFEKWDQ